MDAIKRLIDFCGSQSELARRSGVSQPTISRLLSGKQSPDGPTVLALVAATRGSVKPHDLAPEIYPDPDWLPPRQATQ